MNRRDFLSSLIAASAGAGAAFAIKEVFSAEVVERKVGMSPALGAPYLTEESLEAAMIEITGTNHNGYPVIDVVPASLFYRSA